MLEIPPEVEAIEKGNQSVEASLEKESHLDVATQMKEHNAYFIHMIQVTDLLDVSENNKSINTKNLSIENKLDILYGISPTLSASTVRPATKDGTFYGGFGVVFSHGEIVSASPSDDDTIALSHKEKRVIGGVKNSVEDINRAIDRSPTGGGYNEIILQEPVVCGGFMKLASFAGRTTYEEEEFGYSPEEKVVSKVGIIDMSPERDRHGKLTGTNYDKPFSTLLEMTKRGRTFVMSEDNQMYIIKDIDEKTKKVEFIDTPINPTDMAVAYGEEKKINKYAKAEMEERLAQEGIKF